MSRAALTLLAVLMLLAGVAPPAAPGSAVPGGLVAGAATAPLRVPDGAPLGGYGAIRRRLLLPDVLDRIPHAFWFKPHEGELDRLAARALVLEQGSTRVVWVGLDVIAVDRAFVAALDAALRSAGLPAGTVIVSATHTHSGPGAILESPLAGLVALDRYDAAVRDGIVAAATEAVRLADLDRRPARVGAGTVSAPPITVSRLGLPLDPEIVVVKVVGLTGEPIAALWNFAIHPTMLGAGNLKLSGDVAGLASTELERRLAVPALFVNGALGDVSPQRRGRGAAAEEARALADAVEAAWTRIPAVAAGPLVVRKERLRLPDPYLSLRSCLGRWVPSWLSLPLGGWLSRDVELVAGLLADTAWVTVPGELQTELGRAVKAAAAGGVARAFVAGLSNGYLGYFLTERDHSRVGYVPCANLHGAEGGTVLTQAAAGLIRSLGNAR